MPRRRRSSPAARAALGLGVGALALALLEIVLRLAGVAPAYRAELLGQWRVTPNQVSRPTSGPRDQHSFVLSTNADGLRTQVPVEKARWRVALLGDSTVFGWGVDDGETVADGVQRALGERAEVLNAGQPGYSTVMAAWLFDEVVARYQPDLTVVFVPMHDTNRVLVSDAELLRGGATLAAKARVALARESRVYELLRGLLFAEAEKPWLLPQEAGTEPRVPRVSDDERTDALDGMRATMAAWGGALAVGYLPFQADIETVSQQPRPTRDWMLAYAAGRSVAIVDASACCRGTPGLVLKDDPGHLTREGNYAAGAAIAAQIAP